MGARGPAPTPKAVLEKRGSWLARNRPDDLTVAPGVPQPPKRLKGEALAEWRRITAILGTKNVLGGDLDRAGLVAMCDAWGLYEALMVKQSRVPCGGPKWARLDRSIDRVEKRWSELAKRFGLTPADRPRVKVTEQKVKDGKSRFFEPKLVG